LIHGGEVVGTFDTYADALTEGYKLFKLEPFLVKQIQAVEQAHFIAGIFIRGLVDTGASTTAIDPARLTGYKHVVQ
jgi:hypothetical protein